MKYNLTTKPTLRASECLVVGIFAHDNLPDFAKQIDNKHQGLLTRLCKKLRVLGDTVWQSDIEGHSLLLVHCGERSDFKLDNLTKRFYDIMYYFNKERVVSATLCIPPLPEQSADWQLEQMLLLIEAQRYQLNDFKSKNPVPHQLESVSFFLPNANEQAITTAKAIAEGIQYTRTLANLPANICTPTYLAKQASMLAAQHERLQCKILDHAALQQLGMGALLAVGQGSSQPPVLIEIQYQGAMNKPPIVLVGKGITFDSGGLSLKPADGMTEMKYDMAGAASVLGTIKACALLELPINVIGIVACAENMPSGTSMRPGDIITSLSGQTIEVINTDAEGRLVLADALTYTERFNPDFVIDIATLTGAVIIALGNINSGLMTTDDALAQLILSAAEQSGDKTWRLPLQKQYEEVLESPIADMVNATFDRSAGSVTAACFLSRFTEKYRWAHLDVAGTAWVSGKKRNATGRPVPLLIQILRHVADSR